MRPLFLSRFEKQLKVVNPRLKYAGLLPILILLLTLPTEKVFSQSSEENYIYVQEPTDPVENITSQTEVIRSVQYFDGLGRPKQVIQIQGTPNGKDIVTKIEYDGLGRQAKDYLPVPTGQDDGNFIIDSDNNSTLDALYADYYTHGTYPGQTSSFGTEYFYSQKTFEDSPLNRILSQAAPGDTWKKGSGHEIGFQYLTNKATEVRKFEVNPATGDLEDNGYYAKNQLYKIITTDENGNDIKEYKDKQGRIILKQARVEKGTNLTGKEDPTTIVETYYVYDIYGNLAYVIPPLAAQNALIEGNEDSSDIIKNLCYIYHYDDRNRLIEKKLPGKGVEYMVYDKQDRLVAMQDANLRIQNKWIFTKYDKFGRVVYTGITISDYTNNKTRLELQDEVNLYEENNEIDGSFIKNGITVYYANSAFPTDIVELFTVNYYDKYYEEYVPVSEEGQTLRNGDADAENSLKGMSTASYIRILEQDDWEKNHMVYDVLSRPIITEKQNHLGGYTITESKLNFSGLPTKTTTKHRRDSGYSLVIETRDFFEYDHALRLVYHTQTIGNASGIQVISRNAYDELGRLIGKGVGGEVLDNDRWQNITYKYNIRGWLTDINDITKLMGGVGQAPPASHDDLFSFKIFYDQSNIGTTGTPLYNGNISQTFWKTGSDNNIRGYDYTYDKLNRLRNADFVIDSKQTEAYREALIYDVNGNITKLFRTTSDGIDFQQGIEMDDLTYEYEEKSNLLINVTDDAGSDDSNGFLDWNKHQYTGNNDYEYDDNGNLVLDRNKSIQSITYNHLNLPIRITWVNRKYIEYKYNAAGQKVHKQVYIGEGEHIYEMIDYLDGFQYAGDILQFFPTPEGYVNATADALENIPYGYKFNYVYNYTDHLGNIRVSYTKDPQTGKLKIIDENHYYPFGLKHERYLPLERWKFMLDKQNQEKTILKIALTDEYKYKYNDYGGKSFEKAFDEHTARSAEWQDELGLNFYDYGARNYDPALGRWMNIDPMASKYFSHTPYAYTLNNPVYFIDPDGMQVKNGEDDEVCKNGECEVVELEPVDLVPKKKEKKEVNYSGFHIGFLSSFKPFNLTSAVFGADGERSIHGAYDNMNSAQHIEGYRKMQDAKREGEWFAVGVFAIALAPEIAMYGSVMVETKFGLYVVQTLGKTGIDATAQYAISGDVNWWNAAAGSVLPGKAGLVGSPILSEGADITQNFIKDEYTFKSLNPQKSLLKVGGGYLGNLSGMGTQAVSSDWSSKVGSFIFSNGIQSFQTQGNSRIIDSQVK